MKEVIEMAQALLEMKPNTYMKCKYTLLAVSADHKGTYNFINKLFEVTDRRRPPLIEMKKGGCIMANLATEIIGKAKRQRNIWRIAAIISIALNIIQWLL